MTKVTVVEALSVSSKNRELVGGGAPAGSDLVQKRPPRIKVVKKNGRLSTEIKCEDKLEGIALLGASIGISDPYCIIDFLRHLANISCGENGPDENLLNANLALVQGFRPKCQTEAMLALQMVTVHNATIDAGFGLRLARTDGEQVSGANILSKLARTFTLQSEAMKRLQGGENKQAKVNQHIHLHEEFRPPGVAKTSAFAPSS